MRARPTILAVAVAGAIAGALQAPVHAQTRWGVHKDHYGVYTSPRKGNPLPWKQGAAVDRGEPVPAGRSRSGGFLPWQQPVAPNPVPRGAAPGEGIVYRAYPTASYTTGHSWSTGLYVLGAGYGGLYRPWYGGYGGGYGASYRSGTRVGWTYGPRRGKSFIFSTRSGLLGFSTGRFGFTARW